MDVRLILARLAMARPGVCTATCLRSDTPHVRGAPRRPRRMSPDVASPRDGEPRAGIVRDPSPRRALRGRISRDSRVPHTDSEIIEFLTAIAPLDRWVLFGHDYRILGHREEN